MRIAVFITGMILAMGAVGIFSVSSGASVLVTILRVLGTAFLAQMVYLAAVLLMARFGENKEDAKEKQKVSFRRSQSENTHT